MPFRCYLIVKFLQLLVIISGENVVVADNEANDLPPWGAAGGGSGRASWGLMLCPSLLVPKPAPAGEAGPMLVRWVWLKGQEQQGTWPMMLFGPGQGVQAWPEKAPGSIREGHRWGWLWYLRTWCPQGPDTPSDRHLRWSHPGLTSHITVLVAALVCHYHAQVHYRKQSS